MLPLFQKVIVNKYQKKLSLDLIDMSYAKYSKFYNDFGRAERIKSLKEEQYQEGFFRELFVECLGYTISPDENFNLTTEFKNKTDAEKADGAILKDNKPIAVIELKSAKTKDLKTIEKQAFNYKAHQSDCKYVITSNFEKIRLYINDATEFEEFNIFQLSKDDFKFLYLCFCKESIFDDIPAKIKEKSNQHEEQISKKLYKDYSEFRSKIFQNLTKNNLQTDKLLLFKKSQKLLDRFLFVFFAEDKGLLPANTIKKIVTEFKQLKEMDHYTPLYNEFKRFFGYINKGNKKYQIEEYNGGLFEPDEILDNVILDDEVLIEDSLKLSNYDFDSEVDVNILGHIFEHSLTDIEKLNAEISGEKIDKKQTRRKKEGVFYTPNYITKYIVENTVGTLCEEKKKELKLMNLEVDATYTKKGRKGEIVPSHKGEKLIEKLDKYKEWLLTLKILDPACGSGAFLNQALNFLIEEHNYIIELETDIRKGQYYAFDIDTAVLENNLYGVDINEESVEIAKLSLWLKTAKRGRKLTVLSNNIKCGNSLIDDPKVAGEKAFDWNKEFPQIFTTKDKKTWHVTTAIHNSRYSQRMIDYNVKVGEAVLLSDEDEITVTKTIAQITKEDKLNIPAYNICNDHLHMIIVCEEEELSKIVGKIKAVSARKYNIEKNITRGQVRNPSDTFDAATRGQVPLSEKEVLLSENEEKKKKKKYNSLWTQKFGRKEIVTDEQLNNTITYIRNNRKKHELSDNNELQKIIKEFTCSVDHALRIEYNGGFDVVIGNPPYVLCQPSNTNIELLEFYKTFEVAGYKIDLFHLFFEKSINLLKSKGLLGFISPNTFMTNKYINKLRSFILSNCDIQNVITFNKDVFNDASVDVSTTILRKQRSNRNNIHIFKMSNSGVLSERVIKPQKEWESDVDNIFNIKPEFTFNKINCKELGELSSVTFGLQTKDKKTFVKKSRIDIDWENCYTGKDVNRYYLSPSTLFFKNNKEIVKAGGSWDMNIHHSPKIVVRQIGNPEPIFAFDQFSFATLNTMYSIVTKPDMVSLKYLLSILNSTFLKKFWKHNFLDNKQLFPKIKGYQLKQIPIKIISKSSQKPFIKKADLMISLNKQKQEKINKFLHRLETNLPATAVTREHVPLSGKKVLLHTSEDKYIATTATREHVPLSERKDTLSEKQGPLSEKKLLTKKLKAFYKYDFKTLFSELKKKKIKLTLSEQDEWEEYFDKYKTEINILQKQIDKTDNEIDQMVYKLYGLTKEEIEIVEYQ